MLRSRAALLNPAESRARAFIRSARTTVMSGWPAVASAAIRVTGSPPRRRADQPRVGAGTIVSGTSSRPHSSKRCMSESQRLGQRRQQISPATVFHRNDRPPPRPRVAAEREHRHLRVDTRGDDARRVEIRSRVRRRRPRTIGSTAPHSRRIPAEAPDRAQRKCAAAGRHQRHTQRWGQPAPPCQNSVSSGKQSRDVEDVGEFRSRCQQRPCGSPPRVRRNQRRSPRGQPGATP